MSRYCVLTFFLLVVVARGNQLPSPTEKLFKEFGPCHVFKQDETKSFSDWKAILIIYQCGELSIETTNELTKGKLTRLMVSVGGVQDVATTARVKKEVSGFLRDQKCPKTIATRGTRSLNQEKVRCGAVSITLSETTAHDLKSYSIDVRPEAP